MPATQRLAIITVLTAFVFGCGPRDVAVDAGSRAPSISLVGANREGVLSEPLRLQDFRGQTVVLAFFYKARTPG